MINRRIVLSAAAIAGLLAVPLAAAAEPTEINFGIISTESTQNLRTQWDPLLAEMAKKTGLKVNPFFASDYAGIIEGMRFGKVQVAWYGNKSAMEAVDRADGEVFAQTVNPDGTQGYYGLLLANAANNALNTVDDALKCDKSLTFGNGDPNSTSGFLVPSVFIFSAKGIDPKSCYKTVTNANHETNAMAVANGQVDIATNNTENMTRIEENNPAAFKKIKIIWRSPLIPSDPIVWRKDLDQATKDKLMTFFMTYGRQGQPEQVKAEREVLKGLKWGPFRPSSDAQLYPIRVLEITKSMNKVKSDSAMSESEKEAKIKELQAQKANYEKLMTELPQS
jgi:phosphonate transport system substrate-binding protein